MPNLVLYQRQDVKISAKVLETKPALKNPALAQAKMAKLWLHHPSSGSGTLNFFTQNSMSFVKNYVFFFILSPRMGVLGVKIGLTVFIFGKFLAKKFSAATD